MCAQNNETGVYSSGVFSSYKSGACVRPGTPTYDAKYDSVALSFGNDIPHNNMQPYSVVYIFKRTA